MDRLSTPPRVKSVTAEAGWKADCTGSFDSPRQEHYVITTRMTIGTLALFATATLSAAQAPAQRTPPAATTVAQTTATLAGCLYRESQVPGRTPTVVERAGVLEDYILADATMPAPARPGTPSGAVGTLRNSALNREYCTSREYSRRALEGTGREAGRGLGAN